MLASNLLVGVWGAVAWARKEPSVWFWYLLRGAQVLVVVQVTLGLPSNGGVRKVSSSSATTTAGEEAPG